MAIATPRVQELQPGSRLAAFAVVLAGVYALPLYRLFRHALENQLWSHVLLVPAISLYLVWTKRQQLPASVPAFSIYSGIPLGLGIVVSAFWLLQAREWKPDAPDYLSITTLSFVSFFISGAAWILGPMRTRALAFPLIFLVFMVPCPDVVTHGIETFFQHTSADAASFMLSLSQTPVLRDGLVFKVPGITIEVAEECSGIRSSLVLFIVSLVGGYLFFRRNSHRAIIALAVIPIAIIRNGFRIFTIAMLCVHVSPEMIHSWIHKRGGPVFFALSLIPFSALLLLFYRRERTVRTKRLQPCDRAEFAKG
ncbi:MAG TPA: exosortase/archaeosortase family protein [Blastocatellia bacterium]|nr:exosortase/archaeosortase family protein [Blastocatellia bacterium]